MRTINFKVNQYDQWIRINEKSILGYCCSCSDFQFRRLTQRPVGMCKHLKKILGWLDNFNFPKPEIEKTLTETEKSKLRQYGKCNDCNITTGLEVHRIIRGNKGGKYTIKNIQILCSKHHSARHFKEF